MFTVIFILALGFPEQGSEICQTLNQWRDHAAALNRSFSSYDLGEWRTTFTPSVVPS
jgi:hypothetical protein